ncbi:MAG: Glyoxalase/bleomycin resistance protein/dioxygenase [Pedosphaera sp.]|nr:Glyoxalase/bleomycin resistance protein/dioxygenase [Pedosphaera sp.]
MKIKFLLATLLSASLSLSAAEPQRPHITGVAHIALYVHDLEQSRAFYKDFLGFAEPYALTNDTGGIRLAFIKISDRQYLELFPEKEAGTDRLNHISIETDDAEAMRVYLAAHGVKVPDKVGKGRIGNLNFNIIDPDGHQVELVQYAPDGWTVREKGKHLPDTRISTRMSHLGILVGDVEASKKFYCDILGFKETWRGSRNGKSLSWVNLKVPEGDDYLELMLYSELPPPGPHGGEHHICLELPDVSKAAEILKTRPLPKECKPPTEIRTGVNGKRQINYYDPDGTRVEVMEPRTADGNPVPPSTAPPPAHPATTNNTVSP